MDRKQKLQKSREAVRIYQALRDVAGGWVSSTELARAAGVAGRTVRAHLAIWVAFDHVEALALHPPHYRITSPSSEYWRGWDEAAVILVNH